MKILITGALGHIGSFLIQDLFKQKSLKIDKLILIEDDERLTKNDGLV